jgi:hypothetical protein
VEKCTQHPGKMWVIRGERMFPLLPFGGENQPWHSTPYQALPAVYVQKCLTRDCVEPRGVRAPDDRRATLSCRS